MTILSFQAIVAVVYGVGLSMKPTPNRHRHRQPPTTESDFVSGPGG